MNEFAPSGVTIVRLPRHLHAEGFTFTHGMKSPVSDNTIVIGQSETGDITFLKFELQDNGEDTKITLSGIDKDEFEACSRQFEDVMSERQQMSTLN